MHITVPAFEDERVQALHRAGSADELIQSLHRGRLFRIRDAQTGLFEDDNHQIARNVTARQKLTVVLITAQPVPGLRVDDLIYSDLPTPNERHHQEAVTKVRAAVAEMEQDGIPITIAGVHRAAGVGRNTATAALAEIERAPRWLLEEDIQVASAQRCKSWRTSLPALMLHPRGQLKRRNRSPAMRFWVAAAPLSHHHYRTTSPLTKLGLRHRHNPPVTPEAEALLASAADGGIPAFVSRNFARILRENGISEEDIIRRPPQDLLEMLRERAAVPTPRTEGDRGYRNPCSRPKVAPEPPPSGGEKGNRTMKSAVPRSRTGCGCGLPR